ncbi:hypothetical protein PYW07_009294 [Mythimna separata]|uniref:Kazal-like domain-containing protein n=1 Tax=Mythimna separata TaxID=271217 RepID=A0AAD7YC91_MYTSE|nr:hypothetical protein PYW07_009294 [Mythimna separata]
MKLSMVFTLLVVLVGVMMTSAQNCICPLIYAPVCGANNVTYDNTCLAGCARQRVVHEGMCVRNTTTSPP